MQSVYIGIDPGISGAVAMIDGENVTVWDTPSQTVKCGSKLRAEYDYVKMAEIMADVKRRILALNKTPVITLELVGTMPTDGRVGAFSFGTGYGAWKGILAALGLWEYTTIVSPLKWKRGYGLLGADKRECLPIAAAFAPSVAHMLTRIKDHNRGDAILLAHWGDQ